MCLRVCAWLVFVFLYEIEQSVDVDHFLLALSSDDRRLADRTHPPFPNAAYRTKVRLRIGHADVLVSSVLQRA